MMIARRAAAAGGNSSLEITVSGASLYSFPLFSANSFKVEMLRTSKLVGTSNLWNRYNNLIV